MYPNMLKEHENFNNLYKSKKYKKTKYDEFNERKDKTNETYDFQIDIVISWVNESNSKWISDYNAYSKKVKKKFYTCFDNIIEFDQLRYSLRTIDKYFECYRKIFLVVPDSDHKPKWLNNNPKIEVINHSTIYSNYFNWLRIEKCNKSSKKNLQRNDNSFDENGIDISNYLPTFNFNSVSYMIPFVPNLLEHFIFLNGQIFFGKNTFISDFFTKEGKPIIYASNKKPSVISNYKIKHLHEYSLCHVTFIEIETSFFVSRTFQNDTTFFYHNPLAMTKTLYKEIISIKEFNNELKESIANRFRTVKDISMQTLYIGTGFSLNKMDFIQINKFNTQFYLIKSISDDRELNNIFHHRPMFFSIIIDEKSCVDYIKSFLDNFVGMPSTFENDKFKPSIVKEFKNIWQQKEKDAMKYHYSSLRKKK